MTFAFLACQLYIVLFIGLHDWLPLGRLNNLTAIHRVDSRSRLIVTTSLSTLPFLVGFLGSFYYGSVRFPLWLMTLLWISYVAGMYGMLRAWYLPYLLYFEPARVARYQERFGGTHAFLPVRHGIRPDTLHVTFHVVLLATVILLGVLTFKIR